MNAIAYDRYGSPDVLEFREVDRPAPAADELLIRVVAASVNKGDHHLMRGSPWPLRFMSGLRRPKRPILGVDVAGRVEAVGSDVDGFAVGDEVAADLTGSGFGAFAEYATAKPAATARKPADVGFDAAATVPTSGATALQAVRDHGGAAPGQTALVTGAAGGVGSFAVQLARHLGAAVTAVCRGDKADFVASLGAERVLDYRRDDWTADLGRYDLVIDAAAYRPTLRCRRTLKPGGRYVLVGGPFRRFITVAAFGPMLSKLGHRKVGQMMVRPDAEDLATLLALIDAGHLAPALDRAYPLADAAQALRRLESGEARGKLVLRVAP